MSETTDDVVAGIICMQCHCQLIDKQGEINTGDFPCYCKQCWEQLPAGQKREGAPWFDESTGEVFSGESPAGGGERAGKE